MRLDYIGSRQRLMADLSEQGTRCGNTYDVV